METKDGSCNHGQHFISFFFFFSNNQVWDRGHFYPTSGVCASHFISFFFFFLMTLGVSRPTSPSGHVQASLHTCRVQVIGTLLCTYPTKSGPSLESPRIETKTSILKSYVSTTRPTPGGSYLIEIVILFFGPYSLISYFLKDLSARFFMLGTSYIWALSYWHMILWKLKPMHDSLFLSFSCIAIIFYSLIGLM